MTRAAEQKYEEPDSLWTEEERQLCQRSIVVTGPRKGWFGRWYMDYYCPAWANIYNEAFCWSERCAAEPTEHD